MQHVQISDYAEYVCPGTTEGLPYFLPYTIVIATQVSAVILFVYIGKATAFLERDRRLALWTYHPLVEAYTF